MDVIGSELAPLSGMEDRWAPAAYDRETLIRGLLEGRVAGPETSHPLENVLLNIELLLEGDEDKQFSMRGLQTLTPTEVLGLVGEAAGFVPESGRTEGPVPIDPDLVLASCRAAGERLASACRRGERVILATGHPVGLTHLYVEVARLLHVRGARLLRPAEGVSWKEPRSHHPREIRYLEGVAVLTDRSSAKHTHGGDPMFRMLDDARPDLVFADHGFAGAAIERGVETISIVDVNDPALLVARAQGRTEIAIVMDDNVRPDDYWPCFQAIAALLP